MKNSIFYLIIVALIFTSCKEVQDRADKEETVDTEQARTVKETESDTSCFSSEGVYPETVWIWSKSWIEYYNSINHTEETTSPDFYFSDENLNTLQSYNDRAAGVLIYYIFKEPATEENEKKKIPSLAIINTINCVPVKDCNAVDKKCVLVKWRDGEEHFITIDSLNNYKKYWKENDKKREEIMPGYLSVLGYNYSWNTINSISNPYGGLRIKYGVRTLGPGEILNYIPPSEVIPIDKIGNAVFCNVLVGWEKTDKDINREKSFRDAINNLVVDSEELDFAKPCPAYCGE